uniref:MULE transposase domain-containing protein n=1 Tax=Magallana gigas TaxID=29159 RepID=A0A8W8K0R5_MAGGI
GVRMLVRRAAVLPLIPEHRVEDVWLEALEDNGDDDNDVLRFKDYVTETWVEGHLTHWNHYENDGSRTTNVVEGWHHKFNRMCRRPHPNIFMFIQLIQKEQAANEAKMIQLAAGGVVRPKKKKYRQLDSRIRHLKDRLRQGTIQLMEYADAASRLLHLE